MILANAARQVCASAAFSTENRCKFLDNLTAVERFGQRRIHHRQHMDLFIASAEQDRDAQSLGAKLVPEIKSGKYDQAFSDNNCPYGECPDHSSASALQGYAGPIFSCPEQ